MLEVAAAASLRFGCAVIAAKHCEVVLLKAPEIARDIHLSPLVAMSAEGIHFKILQQLLWGFSGRFAELKRYTKISNSASNSHNPAGSP